MITLEHVDAAVRSWMVAHQSGATSHVLKAVTVIGAPNPMLFLAMTGALFLWWRGRSVASIAALLTPVLAMVTCEIGKRVIARPRPPGIGVIVEEGYAFPSAHATTSAAVCGTLAYLFWQEGFISQTIALLIAVVPPLLVGVSRVYLDVHWATDVVGGWTAGMVICALAATLHRSLRSAQ